MGRARRDYGFTAMATICLLAAGGAARAAPSYSATLRVDDSAGVGQVGDDKLSLVEAILLANGKLSPSALSGAEKARISGVPGRGRRDRILLPEGGAIVMPVQPASKGVAFVSAVKLPSAIPPLEGNDGDMIDGAGAVVSNGPDPAGPVTGLGFVIGSSDFTLQNVTVRGMEKSLDVRPPNRDGLRNVVVRSSTFEDSGPTVTATAADGAPSTIRGFQFVNNRSLGPGLTKRANPSQSNLGFSLVGASGGVPGAVGSPAGETAIVDAVVRGNEIRGFNGAMSVLGASQTMGRTANAYVRNLVIDDNTMEVLPSGYDPALMVWGVALLNGDMRDSGMSNVKITNNRLSSPGLPVYITAVEVVFSSSAKNNAENVRLEGLRFARNTIASNAPGKCGRGVQISGAFIEFGLGTARNNTLQDAVIADNRISGCAEGIFVAGADNHGAPGHAIGNVVRNLRLERNIVEADSYGVVLAGGAIERGPVADAAPGGYAEGNRVEQVRLRHNTVSAPQGRGIGIYGGYVSGARQVKVTGNLVADVGGTGNRIAARLACEQMAEQLEDGRGASANSVQAIQIPCTPGAAPISVAELLVNPPASTGLLIQDMLADPGAKAVLQRRMPELFKSGQIAFMAALTLQQLRVFVPGLGAETVAAIDADMAALRN
jgi:hypothetical protein